MERNPLTFIKTSQIKQDFPYRCHYELEDQFLRESVAKRGVLTPLWVKPQGASYTIVAGHRRLKAAVQAEIEEVAAYALEPGMSEADLFIAGILSNWKQAENEIEKAFALKRAVRDFGLGKEVIYQEILPCLGWEAHPAIVEEALQVFSLEEAILHQIVSGKVPYRGAKSLVRFSAEEQRVLSERVFALAGFSTNQLIQCTGWLFDFMRSQKLPLEKCLQENQLTGLLEKSKGDGRQKAQLFHAALRALRFPTLVKQEMKFSAASRKITADTRDLKLEAPPHFEEEGFVMRANLRRRESLEELLGQLGRKRKALNSLFDIML